MENIQTNDMLKVPNLLSQRDAASYMGVSVMTIWRWIQAERIKPIVIAGRRCISTEQLDALKKSKEVVIETSSVA
jgi:excisionase family DNA binding protein